MDLKNMNNKLAKPKLSVVSPLLSSLVSLFIWLNPLIALSIFVQAPNPNLVIVNSYAMTYLWCALFVILSALLAYGKYSNNWKLTKYTLAFGLFTKLLFAYALVVLGIKTGFNNIIGVMSLWLAISWVQFCAVANFKLPGGEHAR